MSAPTTYPGSTTPLRGLAPYLEADRDALFARDADRDALAKLITQDGMRAALVFGEPGVGRTSLLRAGLLPHLRDHGVVALLCDEPHHPTEAFARALAAATSLGAKPGEKPLDYLSRVVAQAMDGQLYVFIVDDVDLILKSDYDGRLAHELGDLYARVATRSAGRARFLFSSADARLHLIDALERRTGSLFPPAARYRLGRFTVAQAAEVLDKTFILAGTPVDPQIPRQLAEQLGQAGLILPADLQIVARAVRDLKITTAGDLGRIGGATEILARWIDAAAEATGDARRGIRLLGELAHSDELRALPAEVAAGQAGVELEFGRRALPALVARGVCVEAHLPDGRSGYALAHEILAPRVRERAAPARVGARRARQALARAAARGGRLTFAEWRLVQAEGIVATTAEEERSLLATRRFAITLLCALAAAPIVLIVVVYVRLAGSYHLSLETRDGAPRLVARAGSPTLRAFWWLPHDPPFGSVVADTGFTAAMVAPPTWTQVKEGDVGGELDAVEDERREYVARALGALEPRLRGLLAYVLARPEDERALEDLQKGLAGPEEVVGLLEALEPVARGGRGEQELVVQKLADPSPAVQRAALRLAATVARRRPGAYRDPLARALASKDPELRRLAFGVARSLGGDAEAQILARALGMKPEPSARRDLMAALAAKKELSPAALAAAAVGILAASDVDGATRQHARDMLVRAFERDALAAAKAAASLAADSNAPANARIEALELLADRAPREASQAIAADVERAAGSDADPKVQAAALPLFARVSPDSAAPRLAGALSDTAGTAQRVAIAAAWGEVARAQPAPARAALEILLDDKSTAVRAAAARAYGNLGRSSQDKLAELVKKEGSEVSEAAAWGLAASVEAGGSSSDAVSGIALLWKKKGQKRRLAARIFARMARTKGAAVMGFLAQAAREKEDATLRAVGVEGLCAALGPGGARAQATRYLRDAAEDESREVRQRVAACLTAHPTEAELVTRVGAKLAEDADPGIRLEAARALAALAASDRKEARQVGGPLVRLVDDPARDVRVAAARGLSALGGERAPKDASEALARAWSRADAEEKVGLVAAARALGDAGLVRLAAQDGAPDVRAAGLAAAIALKLDVAPLLLGALSDPEPEVRRRALTLLGEAKGAIAPADAVEALEMAAVDRDPAVAEAALEALASLEEPAAAAARLAAGFAHPSEQRRVQVARAGSALAARDPVAAVKVLEPALRDRAHDVRVAVAASLARAYAAAKTPAELAAALARAERDAVARLALAQALFLQGRDAGRRPEVESALAPLAAQGAPLAQLTAQLVLGLVASEADGVAFLSLLLP